MPKTRHEPDGSILVRTFGVTFGLGRRDLVANINFFTKVAIDLDGALSFVTGHSPPGSHVTVRFELDTLVVLSNAPHPLDPRADWPRGDVAIVVEAVEPAAADDSVRMSCPENERGYAESEAVLA